jgi:putative membrane protein
MRRLHPRSAVIDALQGGIQFGSIGLFGGLFLANEANLIPFSAVVVLGPLGFLLGAGYQVGYYYRFGYELSEEELLVTSGVVGRQRREIPLERIQNVDVSRPALKRALGLAVVRFETAGGSSTEATLDAVDPDEADRLQRQVGPEARRRREAAATGESPADGAANNGSVADEAVGGGAETGAGDPTANGAADARSGRRVDDTEVVYEISNHELRVLSAVSFRPGAFAIPFVGIPLGGEDLVVRALRFVGIDLRAGLRELARLDPTTLALGAVALVAAYLLAVWLVSVGLTYLQYYGFRLERTGDELRYERGLVGRYSGTIPLGKVQTVRLGENVLMRQLGYAALAVETAGYAAGSGGDGGSETTVPLGVRGDVLELARDVLAASDDTGRYEASEELRGPDGSDEFVDSDASDELVDSDADDRFTDSDANDGFADSDADEPTAAETTPVADPEFRQPADRAQSRYVRRYLIGLGLVCVGLFGASRLTGLPTAAAGLPALFAPLTPLAAQLKWRHRGYHETEWSLVTREGFWRRRTRIVPVFRLQTVLVSRTIFQRRWTLASVTADTASSAGGGAVVYDVGPEQAEELRVSLLNRLDNALSERRRAARERARRAAAGGERVGPSRTPAASDEEPGEHAETARGDEGREPQHDGSDAATSGEGRASDETEFQWVDGVDPDGTPTNGHHDDEG